MKALINKIRQDKYLQMTIGVFLIGLFLRLYKLNAFVTFLGDQGRDTIVIKRILTFEHLTAIGPPTSIGQVYLGPFYYYFIAPWLFLFNFNPLGLAFGVAFISSIFIIINYFIVSDLFNKKIAFLSSVFLTFSTIIIEFSRFSWNPNLLPYFSLLFFYFYIKSIKNKKIRWSFLSGAFLAFCIQLHYLALFFLPPVMIFYAIEFFKKKSESNIILKKVGLFFTSFIFFSLPLLIFDFRHNFLNLNNFIALSKTSSGFGKNILNLFFSSFPIFNKYVFNVELNNILIYAILIAFIIFLISSFKKQSPLTYLLTFFILTYFGISIYGGQKIPHYFLCIYIFYFILLSYFLTDAYNIKFGKIIVILFMASFIYTNSQGYFFLHKKGNFQIERAKAISKIIYNQVKYDKYNITSLPMNYSDTTYRYFLEISGKKPIEKDSTEKGRELFVVCEEDCDPMNSGQWDIAFFGGNKILGVWKLDNVKIYKLIKE